MSNPDIEKIVLEIKNSKKYRHICESTIRNMVLTGLEKNDNIKKAIKYAKKKLHHISALYLGDPDYDKEGERMKKAVEAGREDELKDICLEIASHHVSTGERMKIIDNFYEEIFKVTGKPEIILDIASGLNPLFFFRMNLSKNVKYYAYEINEKRVAFINDFFSLAGIAPCGKYQDVLVDYPEEEGDVAFLLKMVHCFEIREKGCTLPLLEKLKVPYLIVSFPTENIHKTRNIEKIYENMFLKMIKDKPWEIERIRFENELVFCLKK